MASKTTLVARSLDFERFRLSRSEKYKTCLLQGGTGQICSRLHALCGSFPRNNRFLPCFALRRFGSSTQVARLYFFSMFQKEKTRPQLTQESGGEAKSCLQLLAGQEPVRLGGAEESSHHRGAKTEIPGLSIVANRWEALGLTSPMLSKISEHIREVECVHRNGKEGIAAYGCIWQHDRGPARIRYGLTV